MTFSGSMCYSVPQVGCAMATEEDQTLASTIRTPWDSLVFQEPAANRGVTAAYNQGGKK